jgi:hypothetical protein
MRRYRHPAPMRLSLCLFALGGCAAQPAGTASQAAVPALQPDMARVWVLRQPSQMGTLTGADPMVFVNGAPLAQSAPRTVFFHDFQPGTYRFTVQPYGTPANLVDTLQLAPGMEAYVKVEAMPNWQMGSTAGGASFAVLTMSPAEAPLYMQSLTDLGQR